MRMFIHGIKSLIRRPAKTAMLFVILFIVFNLIFVGFIIQNSVKESKAYIRSQIGGVVEYKMDYTEFMDRFQNPGSKSPSAETARPAALSLAVAEKIAGSQYVESYYITESANVSSETIEPAETQETSGGFQMNFSDFTLSGTNKTESVHFATGDVTLAEGSALTSDNLKNGDKVVIISQDVADANDLVIGDNISLATVTMSRFTPGAGGNQQPGGTSQPSGSGSTTGDSYDYEVIGIYEAVSEDFDVNTVFTSNTVIYELNGTSASDESSGSIVYLLKNADDVDAFIAENTPYLTSEYHTLYSNDETYQSLTEPLNLISFITSILIWVVFIAGAAIILAIVTIFVRDRKFEIGLLLSSGEGKLKIVSQFVFEMMVIAIVAFTISVASSNVAAKSVSNWIVENQLLSSSSLIGNTGTTATTPANLRGPGFDGASVSVYGSVDMESVAAEFNVSVNSSVVMELLLASVLLVLIGSIIPLTAIMGFNPKRILQDY